MPINHVKTATQADGANTDIVRPSDWNSVHAYTLQDGVSLSGNTSGGQTLINSGTVYLAGGNNIWLSQDGNSVTINQGGNNRNWDFPDGGCSLATTSLNGASISHAGAFYVPYQFSISFMRIPVVFTQQSSANGSSNATMNASAQLCSTWNYVIYSIGSGASSQSLQYVTSGSEGFTFMNSLSVDTAGQGSQGSYSQFFYYNQEGVDTTFSTQYSESNGGGTGNYQFSTNGFSNFTGNRWLDLGFNITLPAGAYWLVFGYSSSTATNSTGMSFATNAFAGRYSTGFGVPQITSVFGLMGSTNSTTGGFLGAGSFSRAGGGTTSSIALSQITTIVSHMRPYFQFILSS